jgi:hypothetical protein
VYERLAAPGARAPAYAVMVTQLVSGVWHGVYGRIAMCGEVIFVPLYISLVIIHTKHTGGHEVELTARYFSGLLALLFLLGASLPAPHRAALFAQLTRRPFSRGMPS